MFRDHAKPPRRLRRAPFPDVLEDGIAVEEAPAIQGGMSFSGHTMVVPLGASPIERFVRMHEMGHLKYTPSVDPEKMAKRHGVTIDSLQVCEDARVNTLLEKRDGLPMTECGNTDPDLKKLADDWQRALAGPQRAQAMQEITRFLVASQSRCHAELVKIARSAGATDAITLAQSVVKHLAMRRGTIRFGSTVRAAKALDDGLQALADKAGGEGYSDDGREGSGDSIPSREGKPGGIIQAVDAPIALTKQQVQSMLDAAKTEAVKEMLETSPADLGGHGRHYIGEELIREIVRGKASPAKWGQMEVEYTPMGLPKASSTGKSFRPSDMGLRIKTVSRALTDGKCFARKMRHRGGSLLLDGSGSMCLTETEIAAILRIAPVAWIAVYGANRRFGRVRVLAMDGKVCKPDYMESPGSCNVIDGPALRLLAKQAAPRIWICDGMVTEVGDHFTTSGVVECAQICATHNIKRVPTVGAAIMLLGSLGKPR